MPDVARGNTAAALHGAPVTTIAFDFMFRATPANLAKLKRFADGMRAEQITIGSQRLWVADLADIIASKRAAGRARDKAILRTLETTRTRYGRSPANHGFANGSVLKKSSSIPATLARPEGDGCVPSPPRSARSHTRLSPPRGVVPSAQR